MINVAVIAGNAVADPIVRATNSGKQVASVRMAVNNPINEKEVLFIDVDVWEKQAEFVQKYVKKGSLLSVVGRLKQDSWEKDGQKQSKISIIAEKINFVNSGKKKSDAGADSSEDDEAPAPRAASKAPAKAYAKAAPKASSQQDDDDIPI